MDYTAFLSPEPRELRLPYFAGTTIQDAHRAYRLRDFAGLKPGWHRFRLKGRYATPLGQIPPETDSWNLPQVRGHHIQRRLVTQDKPAPLYGLADDALPARYAPVIAGVWFDGHLLFSGEDFETGAENLVRLAYEEERGIAEIKGVTPSLALAFFLDTTQRALVKQRDHVEQEIIRLEKQARSFEGRLVQALRLTGATLRDFRPLGDEVGVRLEFHGAVYECVIDANTLQILDSGICLDGEDREINLSSLTSVYEEQARRYQY